MMSIKKLKNIQLCEICLFTTGFGQKSSNQVKSENENTTTKFKHLNKYEYLEKIMIVTIKMHRIKPKNKNK